MLADIILTCLALLALFVSSVTDLKKKEVPDWVSYTFVVSALLIRAINSLVYSDFMYFLYGLIGFIIMFFIGNLMYYTKQWGGGDSKLLMGLGASFGTKPYFVAGNHSFLFSLLLNIIIIGAVYGVVFSIYLAFKNYSKFIKEYRKISDQPKMKTMKIIFILLAAVFILPFVSFNEATLKTLIGIMIIFVASYPFLYCLMKAVENVCMYIMIPVSKLTEGDWVVDEKIRSKFNISPLGVEKPQLALIKKSKINKIKIKEGVPFVPSFFIALLVTLIYGALLQIF